jgi:hypothetical protein
MESHALPKVELTAKRWNASRAEIGFDEIAVISSGSSSVLAKPVTVGGSGDLDVVLANDR